MAFDPRTVLNSQAFAIAGGVVIGAGLFTLIWGTIENLVRPLFNLVFENGVVTLSRNHSIYLGCGGFLSACFIASVCVALGFLMIRGASK